MNRLVLLVLLAILTACGSGSRHDATVAQDGGMDSDTDSSVPSDAGMDSDTDSSVPSDAGMDSGVTVDAGTDTGIDSDVPVGSWSGTPVLAKCGGTLCCALTDNHLARCWGYAVVTENASDHGPDYGSAEFPTRMQMVGHNPFNTPVDFAVGGNHVCFLGAAGGVECAGISLHGEAGTSLITEPWREKATFPTCYDMPDVVNCAGGHINISGAVSIIANAKTTCARKADGSTWCWGEVGFHRTSVDTVEGNPIYSAEPVLMDVVPTDAVDVYLGRDDSKDICWSIADIGVYCDDWSDFDGAFGLTGVYAQASIGRAHIFSRYDELHMTSAGDNTYGQNVGSLWSFRPTAICAGDDFNCFIDNRLDSVYCWGRNHEGQVGSNSSDTIVTPPQHVYKASDGSPLQDAASITCASNSACALLHDGSMYCWGSQSRPNVLGHGGLVPSPRAANQVCWITDRGDGAGAVPDWCGR